MTENLYDGQNRVTDSVSHESGDETWRTRTQYAGDRTTVIPRRVARRPQRSPTRPGGRVSCTSTRKETAAAQETQRAARSAADDRERSARELAHATGRARGRLEAAREAAADPTTCDECNRPLNIEDECLTESRWTERQLGHPVVKVFNAAYAHDLLDKPRPAGAADRIALPLAGDDEDAKQTVTSLLDELGFGAVDAGGLDESWRQQPGTPVYGPAAGADEVVAALAAATAEHPVELRA